LTSDVQEHDVSHQSFLDILQRALINEECHVRTAYFHERDDSGLLIVTTSDDLVYSIHFNQQA